MSAPHSGGGVATHRGIQYQDRVAAWVAVRILAEQAASPPWSLPADVTLEFLRCETEQPVDDILVGTARGGCVFIQVKHTLTLEKSADSGLASAADQFVRQYIAHRGVATGRRPWERALDVQRDRLVLVTGPGASASIRQHLPLILQRLLSPVSGLSLDDATTNHTEREVLGVVRAHLSGAWLTTMGVDPTEDDLRLLLGFLQIQTLDVDPGGNAERGAKDLLRASVLHDPTQADAAWNILVQV